MNALRESAFIESLKKKHELPQRQNISGAKKMLDFYANMKNDKRLRKSNAF